MKFKEDRLRASRWSRAMQQAVARGTLILFFGTLWLMGAACGDVSAVVKVAGGRCRRRPAPRRRGRPAPPPPAAGRAPRGRRPGRPARPPAPARAPGRRPARPGPPPARPRAAARARPRSRT